MTLGFANRVLSCACGNIEDLLGKLDGIARTFGHEASMPQFSGYFETETLPDRGPLVATPHPIYSSWARSRPIEVDE